jgi:hypothetical protein
MNMSLINICNQASHVGQEMLRTYNAWKEESDEAINNPWRDLHQFTIYVPHPEQEYEEMTLEEGLNRGYNIEVKPLEDRSYVPYTIPEQGHFVVVLKQDKINADFQVAGTGIFVRPLGVMYIDIVVDADAGEYQSVLIKHPIIRNYPEDWEDKLGLFLKQEISGDELPSLIGYVDQSVNQDYRPPSWSEMYLSGQGFAGF